MKRSKELQKWLQDNTNCHLCQCGCGELVVPNKHRYYRGADTWFIPGHQNRGANHPNYKGGQVIAKGYVWFLIPDHPRHTPRGYVKRAWLVMEEQLGRYLEPGEIVHHKDGDKLNDDPNNLMVTDRRRHGHEHNGGTGNPAYRHDIDTQRDILPLMQQGFTHPQIAATLGCSRSTIVKRLRKFRAAKDQSQQTE